jgi:hypothetical protein
MRNYRTLIIASLLFVAGCATPPAPEKLTLDVNTAQRVAGRFVDKAVTLQFDFEHDARSNCYAARFSSSAGQALLNASSCPDGDVVAIGDRVTMRAPAGQLLGGTTPHWDEVQVTGSVDDARALLGDGPLALATQLGEALVARGDVDTSALAPALVRAAAQEPNAAAVAGPSAGAITTASPTSCITCNNNCILNFTWCSFNPFIAPFCPIWLSQCQTNCLLTGLCP